MFPRTEASRRQQWRTVWPGTPTSAALTAARIPDDCRPRLPPQTCCIVSLVLEKTPFHALPRRCVDCSRPKENAPTPVGAQSRGCKEGSSHSNWTLHTVYEGFATEGIFTSSLREADFPTRDRSGPGSSVKLRGQYLSSLMPSFRVSLAGVE